MRERKKLPSCRLDIAEGDLYFNTGHYRQGLTYYKRALESEEVRAHDDDYMDMLHRMISSYDCLHEETRQTYYTKLLLEKARACGDKPMESVALFNMGKMLYYQEDKQRGYDLIDEAISMMEDADFKYKYDNLRYDYNTLLIMLQRDSRDEEALGILDNLERIVGISSKGVPAIASLYEKERKTLLAQRAVLFGRLKRYDEAEQAYREWYSIGGTYMKDDYLVIPYLMDRGRYEEAIRLYLPREQFLIDGGDSVNYHMMTVKRTLGQAYAALGDYKDAAVYFEALAVLTDSLKRREQQSAAMDLAIANEVYEKEHMLQAKDARIRIHMILLVSVAIIVFFLAAFLWRSIYHARTIRCKNRAMVATIAELITYKDRLLQRVAQDSALSDIATDMGTVKAYGDPHSRALHDLFEQLDMKINSQRLFLNPNLSREDIMRVINVSKNQISQIIQEGAGTNLAGYVNGLRMEYAARQLIRHPEYTINAIAQESGINNLSSFHRLFKAKFGMTPAEFRNERIDAANHNCCGCGDRDVTTADIP